MESPNCAGPSMPWILKWHEYPGGRYISLNPVIPAVCILRLNTVVNHSLYLNSYLQMNNFGIAKEKQHLRLESVRKYYAVQKPSPVPRSRSGKMDEIQRSLQFNPSSVEHPEVLSSVVIVRGIPSEGKSQLAAGRSTTVALELGGVFRCRGHNASDMAKGGAFCRLKSIESLS